MTRPKCPTCFRQIPQVIEYLACVGTCPTESLTQANQNRGWDAYVRPTFAATSGQTSGTCPKCKVATRQEACPSCRGPIPAIWRDEAVVVTSIAMAGARTTGKSLYLGALIGQLRLWVTTQQRSTLTPLEETERVYDERYGGPLYQERRLLPPTAAIQDDETAQLPLMYSFVQLDGRRRVIVLRDVAGEDLQEVAQRGHKLQFLTRADGVIALLDPYKVDRIRNVVADFAGPGGELGADGVRVIEHLLSHLSGGQFGPKVQVPFAVTLSKFDVLQRLREVDGSALHRVMVRPGSPLRRDPSMGSPDLKRDDLDLLDAEMRALFLSLDLRRLLNLLDERAEHHQYFAVSALGAQPEGDAVPKAGIAPFRVLDPLRWILEVAP